MAIIASRQRHVDLDLIYRLDSQQQGPFHEHDVRLLAICWTAKMGKGHDVQGRPRGIEHLRGGSHGPHAAGNGRDRQNGGRGIPEGDGRTGETAGVGVSVGSVGVLHCNIVDHSGVGRLCCRCVMFPKWFAMTFKGWSPVPLRNSAFFSPLRRGF